MDYENTIDLSEEWAQFLYVKGKSSDGYWSYRNWYNVANYGIVSEDSCLTTLVYGRRIVLHNSTKKVWAPC